LKLRVITLAAAVALVPASAWAQDANRSYLEGVDAFEDARYEDAIENLERAVGLKPEAGGRIRRGGAMLVDYTPYAMLAIAYVETSRCEQAFGTWTRGGGFATIQGRAPALRPRTTAAHNKCRTALVDSARTRVAGLDLSAVDALSRNQYVAPQWNSTFKSRYDGVQSAIAGLNSGLDDLARATPLDPAAVATITAAVPNIERDINELRRAVEQAAVPPAAPTPAPAATPATAPVEQPPVVATPKPEPVRSTPARATTPTPAATAPATTARPETNAARSNDARPAAATPPAAAASRAATTDTGAADADVSNAVLGDRLAAALSAFYSRGDLEAVLRQTDATGGNGASPQLLWQLRVLRAAAYYSQFRLGLNDTGATQARTAISEALQLVPAARPTSAHFSAGFVELFSAAASDR
jgi:outer membrane biosynthesis protein TonB